MSLALLLLLAGLAPVDESGYPTLLKSGTGRVLLVDFWATWCAPCRKEMPALAALQAKFRARGLLLITVSADEPEQEADALRFLKRHRVPGPAYIKRVTDDDRFIRRVDPRWSGALPALFLYDRAGRLVTSFVGETEAGAVEAAVRKLL
ncbi:MAG: TlpA family protein disulfide reductase [Acidobacteria bacterium]|nr:TlpA family protein disulfide reductase [Acidobacteriota bacterium]